MPILQLWYGQFVRYEDSIPVMALLCKCQLKIFAIHPLTVQYIVVETMS